MSDFNAIVCVTVGAILLVIVAVTPGEQLLLALLSGLMMGYGGFNLLKR